LPRCGFCRLRADDVTGSLIRLLERETELESLGAHVRDAAAGVARLAIVEGPAGIGKTRLVIEARREAADAGFRVCSARGGELEREFPFGVVRQLFEPALSDPGERERAFAGAGAAARPVFEEVGDGGDASFAVLHGLYWLTANLCSERPLLLAIDDLHWCDRPSLRFLAYLVRRLEGLPLLVVVSLRPAELGVDTALVAEIAGDPLAVTIAPRPLSGTAGAELVRERLGGQADDAFTGACHAATGGNPLLLNELLKTLEAEGVSPTAEQVAVVDQLGPRAASRAVLLRLMRLSDDAIGVARALAVLGDGAETAKVAALAGLDQADVAAAASELARAEILRPGTPLGFVHALVGAAVYSEIAVREREVAHERAARLLDEARAPAEQVAAHLLAIPGRGEEWIVEALVAAARDALQKGAAESAVAYLSRALTEPPPDSARGMILFELGTAEALTNAPAATEHLRAAYDLIDEPPVRAGVAHVLARALMFTGHPEEALEVSAHAAAGLPSELREMRHGLDAFGRATTFFGSRPWSALAVLAAERALPPDPTPVDRADTAVGVMAAAYTGVASAAECAELALRALEGGHLLAYDNGMLSMAAILTLAAADRDEVMLALDASLADAHARGSLFSVSSVHLWRGFSYTRRGDLPEAEADLRAALEEFEVYGYSLVAGAYLAAFLGRALVDRGDVAGARAAVDAAAGARERTDGHRFWLNAHVEVLAAEGRWREVAAAAEQLARLYPEVVNPAVGHWRALRAEALDRLGRGPEALAAAREELELSERWGAPGALARSLRTLGLLELGLLERDAGLGRLRDAVDAAAGTPARLEHARSLAALGAALGHSQRPSDAREPLRAALELAEATGAEALAQSVRAELAASGARPRSSARSLTVSEQRVTALAAEGQTNRDIAQALFVTPKTVEVHLSNAYRKLGIRSRRELASALVTP
jgi:DNA-binding CsgD family transcriptional regulator